MKNKENEIINNYKRIWLNNDIKLPNNRTNSKLLLYHRDKSNKYNLYYPKSQKDINSKNQKKIILSKENLLKNYKENCLKNNNNINRPITSNLRQKMFNKIHNSTATKSYSAKNLTKDSNNSFNVSSKNRFISKIDNNIYQSSSYRNKNQPVKIKFKMKYSSNSNISTSQNLINFNSRNNEPSKSIYILDLQNENLSFEKIRSLRNLNLRIIQSFEKQNSNQKNIFQKNNSTSTIIIPKTEKKIINYNRVKNNGHDLILYKNVFYSSFPQGRSNN